MVCESENFVGAFIPILLLYLVEEVLLFPFYVTILSDLVDHVNSFLAGLFWQLVNCSG